MPQIGWFEILVIVVLSVIIIGPKDVPIVLRKVGKWIGSIKKYFNEIQKDVSGVQNSIEEEISFEEKYMNNHKDNKKDE
jgi:sec-independent protein translocase protein TatB